MTGILIQITRAEVECLLTHVPISCDLSQKLAAAEIAVFPKTRLVGFSKMLQCTDVGARKLLGIAQEHGYSDAANEIQRCMRSCGL